MVIRVPADLEASIREKVERGRDHDAAEVFRAAPRSLAVREERVEAVRSSIIDGVAAIECGEGSVPTPALMDEIEREAEERVRLGLAPKPDVRP